MYDPKVVQPMRDELTLAGFTELRTAADVDRAFRNNAGTALVVVNSVCGCAAGGARPGARTALGHAVLPESLFTVFAGQDKDATDQARSYFKGYPPSSPAMAIMKGNQCVFMLERHQIEGRSPDEIAADLTSAFDRFCEKG